jgi:hypothetical protein
MTFPEVYDLFAYWREHPPEHELQAMLARVYTTWEPPARDVSPEEHQKSLEARWKAGAMNPADLLSLFEKTGGRVEGVMPGPMR